MSLDETIKVSGTVKDRLTEYRDENEHTSYDSAIRGLLPDE